MYDYETLIREHDALDAMALNLIATVRGTTDVELALAIRAELSLTLEDHLAKEDSFLYERAIIDSGSYSDAVARFNSSFASLAADWGDYLRSWDLECVRADWPTFAGDTIAILGRLRARIAEENALIYPLALHKGQIRLRAIA